MSIVQWTPDLAVDDGPIDKQHIELFRRANVFLTALERNDEADTLQETMDFLCKYVDLHFRMEEELMRRYAFPHTESHLAEHAYFSNELARAKVEVLSFEGVPQPVMLRLYMLLGDWLVHHVMITDRALGAHIHSPKHSKFKTLELSEK